MCKELIDKIKRKKKVYELWKKGLFSWEKSRSVVRACRDATRKAKAQLEMKLAEGIMYIKNVGFF